jgi:hypothetical protein
MDNQEQLNQNYELPQPQTETLPLPMAGPEQGSGNGELPAAASVQPLQDPASAQAAAHAQAIVGATQPVSDPTVSHTSNLSAADVDLIEKEWVEKAKAIVARTHGDPFTQNKEINKIKADYIKKRYNKDIKLVSE